MAQIIKPPKRKKPAKKPKAPVKKRVAKKTKKGK